MFEFLLELSGEFLLEIFGRLLVGCLHELIRWTSEIF